MNRLPVWILAGVGCVSLGCIGCIVALFVGGSGFLAGIFYHEIKQMPAVERTATGITVTNRMHHQDVRDIALSLHAENIAKPDIAGDFTFRAPPIAAGKKVFFPYHLFVSKTGHRLDPAKFQVEGYELKYHEDAGAASEGSDF